MAAAIPLLPLIEVVPGITHTRFVDNSGIIIDVSCVEFVDVPGLSLLGLRTNDARSQVRTLNGRLTGININLDKYTYFDYQMRRKAETLQYRKNQIGLSKKQQFAQISKTRSGSYYYSNKDLLNNIKNRTCPNADGIIRPPTNSGVHDYKYPGYYYDSIIPYAPSL